MGMILQHSMFGPGAKYIKFAEGGISAVDAANIAAKMPLNDIRIPFDQQARASVVLAKGALAKPVNAGALGEAVTLAVFKPVYDKNNRDLSLNRLQYKLGVGGTKKYTMTEIMVLTGTPEDPVPSIIFDNPNPNFAVKLEVFTATAVYSVVPEGAGFDVFYSNMVYTDLRTADTDIIAVYKDGSPEAYFPSNSLTYVIADGARLTFEDPSLGAICLQYISEAEAKQALSALAWVNNNYTTRQLTAATPRDDMPPGISLKAAARMVSPGVYAAKTFVPAPGPLDKASLLNLLVAGIQDTRDGTIVPVPSHLTIKDAYGMTYGAIEDDGIYTLLVQASDIAGNTATKAITLTVAPVDLVAPVFTMSLEDGAERTYTRASAEAPAFITKEELINSLVVSCIDQVDGPVTLTAANVEIVHQTTTASVANAAYPGVYEVYFEATDLSGNMRSVYVGVTLIDVPVA